MIKKISCNLRGLVSLLIYILNTIFWVIPILIIAIIKLAIPYKPFHKLCDYILNGSANNWVLINNLTQQIFCNIKWHISGLDNLNPDKWYLIVCNHQSWVDILVLQRIFHNKIPFLKFFLKKELFWFPILGLAWWALDFPFMKRYSQNFIKKHPHLKGRDLDVTKKACKKFQTIPVSIINFIEGTRFNRKKQARQHSPYKNLLIPKAGGIAFVLGSMGEYITSFLDVTIAYPGRAKSFWDFLCGNVNDIRIQVRALPVKNEMLGDYFNDKNFRAAFQKWVNALWEQKDRCIDDLLSEPLADIESGAYIFPGFSDPLPDFKKINLH